MTDIVEVESVSNRRLTCVDIACRRSDEVIFNEFYRMYRTKYTKWARSLVRRYHVASYVYEDLVQAAFMHVYRSLATWDPVKASIYTYTYLGVRKAMHNVIREYHSNKKTSKFAMKVFVQSEGDIVYADTSSSHFTMEERLTVRQLVTREFQEDSERMRRFMAYALDYGAVSQLARECNPPVRRQAFYNSIMTERKRLTKKVEYYK